MNDTEACTLRFKTFIDVKVLACRKVKRSPELNLIEVWPLMNLGIVFPRAPSMALLNDEVCTMNQRGTAGGDGLYAV